MITDKDLASICQDTYDPSVSWDFLDEGEDDGVWWAIRRLNGADVVAFRGSDDFQDWVVDLRAAPIPTRLGSVHAGFYSGIEKMWAELRDQSSARPKIITGHSLGAARAAILCGLATLDGAPPLARVVFGEPKPGFMGLAKIIEKITSRSYRNGDSRHHDQVTDLPITFPPFQYVHPTAIIPVTEVPTGGLFARLGVFAWHHVELYVNATPLVSII